MRKLEKIMKDKKYFPVFLDLNNKPCLVVGAGNIAFRKVTTLLEYGGKVKVISKEIREEFKDLDIDIEIKEFSMEDIKDYFLVIAATDNEMLNKKIMEKCNEKKILGNNITSKTDMSVRFASTISTEEYTIGISAHGFPKKSVELKKKIEKILENKL